MRLHPFIPPSRVIWGEEHHEKLRPRTSMLGFYFADVTITAANVLPVATDGNNAFEFGIFGETVTAGQAVYKDSADGDKFKLADANAAGKDAVHGIALNGGASGQPAKIQISGKITIGGTVVAATIYVASATPGGIAPAADLTSGWKTSVIGVATTTGVIKLGINNSGTAP